MTSDNRSEITEEEWINKSQRGELCGVLGCTHPPTDQCSICVSYYCSGHLDLHVHKVADNKEEANEVKNDEPSR
jgi:hypothetical protein